MAYNRLTDIRGRSFITIVVSLAIAALFLRFAAEKIIRINMEQNEAGAQANLKLIATALENYADEHLGAFPANFSILLRENPPYLDRDYAAKSPIRGYSYNCLRLDPTGYNCAAVPVKCNLSGRTSYIISTGGLLVADECSQN